MSTCNRCGAEIVWAKENGKNVPKNPDGTSHFATCGKAAKSDTPEIVGLLTGYNSGSATVRVRGGATKTYAITQSMHAAWQTAGYGTDQWIAFYIDKDGFIQPGARNIQAPDWAAELKDPTGGEVKKPVQKAPELPKQETPCTSPEQPAPAAETPPAPMSDEDRIRAAMAKMLPGDRVGCRISLAGVVNSVIEIKKTHGKPINTEEVKREAVALFLWCDELTTRAVQ